MAQENAVIHLLEFMADRANDHDAALARKALDRFWKNPQRVAPKIIVP